MDHSFRNRLMLATAGVVLVIALSAVTALVALRRTNQQVEQARQIDERLVLLDRLRSDTRELAASARRYMISLDLKEQQRVLAIVDAMRGQRHRLAARTTFAKGPLLEADLEEYIAALMHAMSFDDGDAITRLSRFEDDLVRIRNPLAMTFDEIVDAERDRRAMLRSAHTLARGAQWAVLVASLLGAVLAIGAMASVLRKLRRASDGNLVRSRNELVAAAGELRAPIEQIITQSSQLRLSNTDHGTGRVLDEIARNASRVNGMLAELLDVTAITVGATSLRREPIDAGTLVDDALRAQRRLASEHGIRLRHDAQVAVTVFADRDRIRHVLDSVLQTALAAASPNSEVVVHVTPVERSIRFAIIEPRTGGDDEAPPDLALLLCNRIVDAHGGRFGIQTSSFSRTYWFTLPTEPRLLR
jgi:K+-sensing histidine kinase KdpD